MARVRKGGKWRSTKGSWYGGPRDAQDNDRPALQGATNKVPGIARFDRSTLGDTFEVRAPNGKTIRVRQTDIGPAPWTGKGLDVNYTAVKALGYTEGNFPTGAKLQYRRIGRGDQTSGGVAVARGGKRGKRGRTRSTGSDPDLTLAQQQATVQFGPEESQLQSLLKSAASNYEDDVTRAEEGAKATQLISRASRPRVKAIYAQSTKDTDTANQDVLTAFGKLGAAADPYRAVTARDMAGWKGRIASARSNSLQGLTDREIEAVAGKSQALQKATADYRGDVEKLSDRSTALGREKGAAMAAQLGAIKGKRAESAAELRKIRLQGQIDLNKEKMENASEAEQKRLDRENSVLIERMGNQTSRANAKTSAASKGGGSARGWAATSPPAARRSGAFTPTTRAR